MSGTCLSPTKLCKTLGGCSVLNEDIYECQITCPKCFGINYAYIMKRDDSKILDPSYVKRMFDEYGLANEGSVCLKDTVRLLKKPSFLRN